MTEENTIEEKKREIRPPSMLDALIPILSLIILLAGAIYLYGDEAISGPTQVALLLTTMIAGSCSALAKSALSPFSANGE